MSCDLLPTESPGGRHYQGDVRDLLDEEFDLVIAHPPCTYLANSGAHWLHRIEGRWDLMKEGAEFFRTMSQFNSPRIAIENPIQHGYAREAHGLGRPTQLVQPWMFGHVESKRTGLWLINLPPLVPTDNREAEFKSLHPQERGKVWMMGESKARQKNRSRTLPGLAAAMANQWDRQSPIYTVH